MISWLDALRRDDFDLMGLEVLELIGGERHAILHAHGGDVREVVRIPLPRRDRQPLRDRSPQGSADR
jgi:hypothetical protein